MTKVLLCGACGKMGYTVAKTVENTDNVQIVAGFDIKTADLGFPVYTSLDDIKEEVDAIMELLGSYIERAEEEKGTKYVFLGDKSVLSNELREKMERLEKSSSDSEYTLNIAFNYGGRAELVNAFNELVGEGRTEITEDDISSHLYTRASNDPDLIVRTANEYRISNFLLWQCAYAELYFTDVLWPDFDEKELQKAIKSFYSRKRNFGGV